MLIWLLACSGEVADTAGDAEVLGDEDAGWLGDVEDTPAPAFDEEAVGAAVEDALARLVELHAGPLLDGYDVVATHQTDDCPAVYEDDGFEYWYDSCETEDGTQFEGYAGLYSYADYESDGFVYNGRQLLAVASVVTSDGETFQGAGTASHLTATADELTLYYTTFDPGFSWDGASAEGTWLADGLDPGLYVYRYSFSGVLAQVYVTGSLSLPAGGAIEALAFDDVMVGNELAGVTCPEELAGTLSVLDTEGRWIDLVFDVSDDLWAAEVPGCDGCGTAWYRGEQLGQVCVDPSALGASSGTPW